MSDTSRRPRRLFSVRFFLLSIVLVAALPPFGFSIFLLLRYADTQRTQAESELIDSAEGVARAIEAEFATALATLNVLKQATALDRDDMEAFRRRLAATTFDTGRIFALIDMSGRRVISTAPSPREPLSSEETGTLIAAIRQQSPYLSDVTRDSGSNEVFAYIGVPVMRDGAIRWALVTFLYGERFRDVILWPGVPDNWIVSIVDSHGTHLRRSHLNEKFAGHSLVPDLVKHMADKKTGVLRTTSLEGITLISTVAYAPFSGFAAAVGLPLEQLEAPVRESLWGVSLAGVLTGTAALVLAFFVARILDRGFLTLHRSARNLDRGEAVVDDTHSMIREVNEVVTAMSQVSHNLVERTKALAELTNSLETQVADRTTELVAEMKRREESEVQLAQLQRIEAIGKLTGGIAHDFNNMLAVIISSLELMRRRLSRGDTDVNRLIDSAMKGADNAANLTQRLLAFSRQQALDPQVVDCNKLVAGMSEILYHTIPETIEIETVLAGGLWRTHIDRRGLENAILNLAVNARDAMPEGGKLTIETANAHLDEGYADDHADVSAGQYVMLAVTDTGVGMSEEVRERVFEPFFTTKGTGQGTGLGLSQVHGFIKQSGGHIMIYSEIGQGTTVKLYLPRLVKDVQEREDAPAHGDPIPRSKKRQLVLVAEDEEAVRRGTVSMLEELGYAVLEAESGVEALEKIDSHPEIALLITDVVMPGMNGRQLADEAAKRRPDLRVLFSTGYTRNAIVHHGTLDPGVHLINKPFTLGTLARKIMTLLGPQD